jgi:2-aminoethylphosphonate-pyruvate transaminase
MTNKTILFTPGPLSTSRATKNAMLRDWGSRDAEFIALTQDISLKLEKIAGVDQKHRTHNCVLIQGSGTFVIEATIDTLVPRGAKILVLVNGAYGKRMAKICKIYGRPFVTLETDEDTPPTENQITEILEKDRAIKYVLAVHCETTSGILNPIQEISNAASKAGCYLIIDAMSSFGAIPLSIKQIKCAAIVASSNKCLEGVPGVGFAIIDEAILVNAAKNSSSLSLNLFDQWQNFKNTGQWRFTPPTHVLAALGQALIEHEAEGGVEGRGKRYKKNRDTLIKDMQLLGFKTYLDSKIQSPIIVTFHLPNVKGFDFNEFYERLHKRGFMIYPGKLTKVDSFRIGCIGHITHFDLKNLTEVICDIIKELGVELK